MLSFDNAAITASHPLPSIEDRSTEGGGLVSGHRPPLASQEGPDIQASCHLLPPSLLLLLLQCALPLQRGAPSHLASSSVPPEDLKRLLQPDQTPTNKKRSCFSSRGFCHAGQPCFDGSEVLQPESHMMDSHHDSRALLPGEQLIYAITIPLSISIILANLIIILGIAWNRQLHNTPNYFFLSLLVADLCTGVALPFIPLMGLNRELTFNSCMVAYIFPNFLFLAFLFNLVVVHYERYICIVDPLHYNNLWMHRSFPLALLAVWAPPLLYASLPGFGWNNWTGSDWNGCCAGRQNVTPSTNCSTNETCCSYRRVFPNAFIYLEVYGLVLPAILIIAGMTGRVLWITRGQLKDICRLHRSVERGSQASDREQRLNLRYTRCVVAVSLTFLACWVPYLIYMHVCVAFLIGDARWSSTVSIVLSCTGIGSMAVVPLVLGLANRQYTELASKLLQKLRYRWRLRMQVSVEVEV